MDRNRLDTARVFERVFAIYRLQAAVLLPAAVVLYLVPAGLTLTRLEGAGAAPVDRDPGGDRRLHRVPRVHHPGPHSADAVGGRRANRGLRGPDRPAGARSQPPARARARLAGLQRADGDVPAGPDR